MKPPSAIVSKDTIAPVIPTIAYKQAKLRLDSLRYSTVEMTY